MRHNSTLIGRVSNFFFAEEVPYGMALVRILLPLVILVDAVPRWIWAREFYSTDGSAAPLQINYGFPDWLPVPSGNMAVALMSLLLFTLVTTAIGWKTRWSLVLTTAIYTYLMLMDCMGTLTKYTVIEAHGLLLLTLSDCGAIWSVDSVLRRRREAVDNWPAIGRANHPRSTVWPRRLMQLLLGFIYLGAAFTKMHTPAFFSGDQMRSWMLTNVNSANPLGEWISFYPATLIISAYFTVIWEVLFIFCAWRGWGRGIMLALGVFFHLGTTALLGLYVFPLVCCSMYFSFYSEADAQRIGQWIRKLARKQNRVVVAMQELPTRVSGCIPRASSPVAAGAFAMGLLVVAVAGVEAEYQLDPYHERTSEGKLPLVELEQDAVIPMLRQSARIREADKFLAFDIGSEMFGDLLVNRKNVFHYGEVLVAQCTLTMPHEDMWVECNLHDAEDHVIDRVGQIVERSSLRSNYAFDLSDSLEPGTYFLVIRSGGREITRRAFTLLTKQ